MRILLINSVCGVTSTGRICADLAKTYAQDGHEVRIAYGRDDKGMPEITKQYGVRIGNNLDVKVHGLLTRFFDKHGFGSKKATVEFLKWVDEFNPDVIHLHNLHGYYINIEVLFDYLKKRDIPVVWTLHDCWAMTGHCTHFNAYGCKKWKSGCCHCQLKYKYPMSKGLDRSAKNYVAKKQIFNGVNRLVIATPSIWLKNIVKQSYLGAYDVEVINNGIDTTVFKSTKSNLREQYDLVGKKIALGVASGWGPHKGLDYLKRMANDLPANWKIVIIGLLDEQFVDFPENMIGIKRTTNPQELAAWYSLADVFVNPTLEDTYPTTNLEAQACGTPVVTFDSDGAPETVVQGKGYVVKRMNYEILLKKTIEAANMKETFEQVDIKDKMALGKDYETVYERLVRQKEVLL